MPRVSGAEIKVVGRSGQIALGKSFAGKALRVKLGRNGIIVLTPVAVVPESQLWTLEEPDRARIARGLAWAARTKPRESEVESLLRPRANTARRVGGRGR